MACYHAAASHALPYGITIYFGSPFVEGVSLWLIAATLIGTVWGLCWHAVPKLRLMMLRELEFFFRGVESTGFL